MQDAVRLERGPVLADGHMALVAAFVILAESGSDAGLGLATQGLADIEVLAGDSQAHGVLPLLSHGREIGRLWELRTRYRVCQ